jgi:hypothetical protein
VLERFVKNFLQGPQFGKQIDIGLIRLAFDQRKLEKELRKCLHQRVGSIEREVVQTRAAILRMQEDGKETLDGVRKLTKVLDGRLRDLDCECKMARCGTKILIWSRQPMDEQSA